MHNETNDNPLRVLRSVVLTQEERDSVRSRVRGFVAVNPVRPSRGWYGWFVRHSLATAGIVAALVATGTGAVAHYSKPDSPWYPVKLAVNDRIEVALAGGEEARLDKELAQLERALVDEESVFDRELAAAETEISAEADTDERSDDEDRDDQNRNGDEDEDDDADDRRESDQGPDQDAELDKELDTLDREFRDIERDAADELSEED